ncbi:MAG TPA: phage portal protein, partial [Alphaproteobacteria bacterium]|nr:phage portal protein [Alphaproteobacteria bacterium]
YDTDAVEALSAERDALWDRVGRAEFLTTDEKRSATGYGSLI